MAQALKAQKTGREMSSQHFLESEQLYNKKTNFPNAVKFEASCRISDPSLFKKLLSKHTLLKLQVFYLLETGEAMGSS